MSDSREQFHSYLEYTGLKGLPDGLDEIFKGFEPNEKPLLRRGFLEAAFARFQVPEQAAHRVLDALECVERDEKLLLFSRFLVSDMCSARNRCDVDSYFAMAPICMTEGRDFYSFLLLLACVEPSMELLRARGVPETYFAEIPYRPMENQFRKLAESGSPEVSDFPWDMNFYTCSIFLLDRFLFIPCRIDDPLRVYRNRLDGRVTALYEGGRAFRRDGQLGGVNEIWDEEYSYCSVFRESDTAWTGNRVNPTGFVEAEPITLKKSEWEQVVSQGDMMLGTHVPSGPGYTPERLKNSLCLALEFYDRYFPELPIRGFWSESWLYDTRFSLILDRAHSNILQMQEQMYIYPIPGGDSMLRYELFHDRDWRNGGWESSLQRAAAVYMAEGKRFNTLSMFILRGDAPRVGERPYRTAADEAEFSRTADSHLS